MNFLCISLVIINTLDGLPGLIPLIGFGADLRRLVQGQDVQINTDVWGWQNFRQDSMLHHDFYQSNRQFLPLPHICHT